MATILEKANSILADKQAKILPENLKKGVSVYGVTGQVEEVNSQEKTVAPSTIMQEVIPDDTHNTLSKVTVQPVTASIDENIKAENILKGKSILGVDGIIEQGVKLFETEEIMQADETAKTDDLALLYRKESANGTVDTIYQVITFPATVTLPEAMTSYASVDMYGESRGNGRVNLSSNSFRFEFYGDTMLNVSYTSSDGITYTRTDTGEATIDLGAPCHCEDYMGEWDDKIGYFMQVEGYSFNGLFKYGTKTDKDKVQWLCDIVKTDSNVSFVTENVDCLKLSEIKDTYMEILNHFYTDLSTVSFQYILFVEQNNELYAYIGIASSDSEDTSLSLVQNAEGQYGVGTTNSKFETNGCYRIKIGETLEYTRLPNATEIQINENTTRYLFDLLTTPFKCTSVRYYSYNDNTNLYYNGFSIEFNDGTSKNFQNGNGITTKYYLADTQLNTTADYVYKDKLYYGKNGIETGNICKNLSSKFNDVNAQILGELIDLYGSMEPIVLTEDNKRLETDIQCVPYTSDGRPLYDTSQLVDINRLFANCKELKFLAKIDTSNATNMEYTFSDCKSLKNIPLIDTGKVTNMSYAFIRCTGLTTIPLLDTSSATNMSYMFNGCTNLTSIPQINTSNALEMNVMFGGCENLTTIPLLDTSSATNMSNMFTTCKKLTAIPALDTGNVTKMDSMFYYCDSLQNVSFANTSNVTTMNAMFYNCLNLTDVTILNANKVTNLGRMFGGCKKLTTVRLEGTSNVTEFGGLFTDCISLVTAPELDTSSADSLYGMFENCTSLTTVPVYNTSTATSTASMFKGCTSLTNVPLIDTSNVDGDGVSGMCHMFEGCTSLTAIPQFNTSKAVNMIRMFFGCTSLTTVPVLNTGALKYIGSMFGNCPNLSDESLNNILTMCINATKLSSSDTKSLKYVGLSAEQATKCSTLSNYQAFIDAGWTTGY